MKTEILTLCDNAQDYNGKTVITGTFNEVKAADYPTVLQNICMVLRISFEHNEHINSNLILKAYDIDASEALLMKFDTPFENMPTDNNRRSFVNAILKLDGITLPKPGVYRFEVQIGDWKDNVELYVTK